MAAGGCAALHHRFPRSSSYLLFLFQAEVSQSNKVLLLYDKSQSFDKGCHVFLPLTSGLSTPFALHPGNTPLNRVKLALFYIFLSKQSHTNHQKQRTMSYVLTYSNRNEGLLSLCDAFCQIKKLQPVQKFRLAIRMFKSVSLIL